MLELSKSSVMLSNGPGRRVVRQAFRLFLSPSAEVPAVDSDENTLIRVTVGWSPASNSETGG